MTFIRARGLNKKAKRLPVLEPSDAEVDPDHTFWCAPNVVLNDVTKRAASAYARANDLDLLDLWPADLEAVNTMRLLSRVQSAGRERNRLARGHTAGQAVLLSKDVAIRSKAPPPNDHDSFVKWAGNLRHYSRRSAYVVVPSMQASRDDQAVEDARTLKGVPQAAGLIIGWRFLLDFGPIIACLKSRIAGPFLMLAFLLQPALVTMGTALHPRNLQRHIIAGWLLRPLNWFRTIAAWQRLPPTGELERAAYEGLMAEPFEDRFEPLATVCPMCGSAALRPFLTSHDVVQLKPGVFTLDQCQDCEHIFQNPRLSSHGLSFYYRDVYDGLGEGADEFVLGATPDTYLDRAARPKGYIEPAKWLDIGTAHGHFCAMAQEVWPNTEFHGLDMGAGVETAEARRWVGKAYRGQLSEFAAELRDSYDVVSMFHYLEHTTDPRTELKTIHSLLKPGGILLIEVPNPRSTFSRMLGRYWFGWFQPEHLHFLNVANFERLFHEAGFETLEWHWKGAHVPVHFTFAAAIFLNKLAANPDAPWRARPTLVERIKFHAVWTFIGPPLLFAGVLADSACKSFLARPQRSFNYGVMARRI